MCYFLEKNHLNAALLASGLALSTVTSITNACVPIYDSEYTLACLEKTNCAFVEYFGNIEWERY